MKIGERGQVTIPKKLRDRFGLDPETEIEFAVKSDMLVLKKVGERLNLRKWVGKGNNSLKEMGYRSADEFLKDVRGR